MKKLTKAHRAVLAAALLAAFCSAAAPMGAYATGSTAAGGGRTTYQTEYAYAEGDEPYVPEEISQFGQTLRLVSVSAPVPTESLPRVRTYSYRVSGYLTAAQLAGLPEGVALTPVYATGTRQVDRTDTLTGLPTNDVEGLPQRKTYTDTDGKGPGGSVSGDLALAEAEFTLVGRDEDGLPNDYTAHATYRGEEAFSVFLYYAGEGTFTGAEGVPGINSYTVVATYEGGAIEDPPAPLSAGEPTMPPEAAIEGAAPALSPFTARGIAMLSVGVAVFAAFLIFLLLWLRRRRRGKGGEAETWEGAKPGAA